MIRRPAAIAVALLGLTLLAAAPDAARAPEGPVRFDGHKLVRVDLRGERDVEAMLAISQDHWSETVGVGPTLFRVPPGGLAKLDAAGLKYVVVRDDIQKLIDDERAQVAARAAGGFFDDYRDLAAINAQLDAWVAAQPQIVHKFTVGQSVEGRTIYGVRIGAAPAGSRPGLMLTGCQHAREWIAAMAVMYAGDTLVNGYGVDPEVTAMLGDLEFFIVPVVNPDGYVFTWTSNRLWRKNRRHNADTTIGVDLNRNWSVGYGLDSGSSGLGGSDTYRGPFAFSEPETASLRDFITANTNIKGLLDTHSYAEVVLGVWGYQTTPAPSAGTLIPLGWSLADAISAAQGVTYHFGTAGYSLGVASGILPDWAFGQRSVFAWTVELRDDGTFGFMLPVAQLLPTAQEYYAGVLTLAAKLRTPLDIRFPRGRPGYVLHDATTTLAVDISPVAGPLQAGSGKLFTRIGSVGSFTQAALTSLGGESFQGSLPAAPCGATVEYYVQAATTTGAVATSPLGAPGEVFQTPAREEQAGFADDFETDKGWTTHLPGDTATAGVWTRVAPIGTTAQPSTDNPDGAGTMCYVTGQGPQGGNVGDADVDGGYTTLLSPRLDAAGDAGEPFIEYHRWFSNEWGSNPNSDAMHIDISNDDGSSWTRLERVVDNTRAWTPRQWRIADFVAPTSQMRIRFVAHDDSPASVVEAGVDDVRLTFASCPGGTPGDLTGDGVVNSADLGQLLGAWGMCPAGGSCPADLNHDGVVSSADLALLLGWWQ